MSEPEIIFCEHLDSMGFHDTEGGAVIFIGNGRVVSLCQLCTKAVQLDMLARFMRRVMPRSIPHTTRRGRNDSTALS